VFDVPSQSTDVYLRFSAHVQALQWADTPFKKFERISKMVHCFGTLSLIHSNTLRLNSINANASILYVRSFCATVHWTQNICEPAIQQSTKGGKIERSTGGGTPFSLSLPLPPRTMNGRRTTSVFVTVTEARRYLATSTNGTSQNARGEGLRLCFQHLREVRNISPLQQANYH
jgi:hypothetical protein